MPLRTRFAAIATVVLAFFAPSLAMAQAAPTASRTGDLQVGLAFAGANPDYTPEKWYGAGLYATFDFREHFGLEIDFRQVGHTYSASQTPTGKDVNAYQRDYEIGGRYVRHYGRLHPYAKVMYGRAVMNFPEGVANLAYNQGIIGGGADVNILYHVNVRADYEYHSYFSFPSSSNSKGLSPQVVTIGAAYHF